MKHKAAIREHVRICLFLKKEREDWLAHHEMACAVSF
tara:strand:+ start:1844 stop:1954 length:111 start_codon:yes stop_codon:yes gene_type:complete